MPAHHIWSTAVDPRPSFPTHIHGRRVSEPHRGSLALCLLFGPDARQLGFSGTLVHYRLADGAENVAFTGTHLDLELLFDRQGEGAWLRLGQFHRADLHGLSWLRHRLATARVVATGTWHEDKPAWSVRDEDGELVLMLVIENPVSLDQRGDGDSEEGVRGLIWGFLEGPPGPEGAD